MGTIPTTSVTMTAIQTEFGGDGAISLSEYYRGTSTYSGSSKFVRPEVTAIPVTGAISIGDFRGEENSPPNNPKQMGIGEAEFKGSITRKGYNRNIAGLFTHGALTNRYMPIGTSAWPGFNSTISRIDQGSSGEVTLELAVSANNSTWSSMTIGSHSMTRSSMTYEVSAGVNARWTKTVSTGVLYDRTTGTLVTVSFT